MSLLGDSVQTLVDSLKQTAGQSVIYTSFATGSPVAVTAILGDERQDDIEASGNVLRVRRRDFIIERTDLAAVPKAKDTIDIGDDERWMVMSDQGAPPWEPFGQFSIAYRIHAERVERN